MNIRFSYFKGKHYVKLDYNQISLFTKISSLNKNVNKYFYN